MKQYPDDWDMERIANDQAGGAALFFAVVMFLIVVFLFARDAA